MDHQSVYFSDVSNCPYSDMVVVEGKYLFLSGLISEAMDTHQFLYGDIAFETRQILCNLKSILERYGSDMDHVIRTEVLLRDFAQRDVMNAEYVRHFSSEHMPARLCYGNVGLAGECKIEIMVTAIKK